MKITKVPPGEVPGLNISDTEAGAVYFYKSVKSYVIRSSRGDGDEPFISLQTGNTLRGYDGDLFPVDAELVIR